MARSMSVTRPAGAGKRPLKSLKSLKNRKVGVAKSVNGKSVHGKIVVTAPTAKKSTADGDGEDEKTTERKKIKHSRWFLFRKRVRAAQTSTSPYLNKEASYRIVRWARDYIDLPGAEKVRFKPSAIRALHQAAESITMDIFEMAYKMTLTSKMSELQPSRIVDAIEIWARYNDPRLTGEFADLIKQCGASRLKDTPARRLC